MEQSGDNSKETQGVDPAAETKIDIPTSQAGLAVQPISPVKTTRRRWRSPTASMVVLFILQLGILSFLLMTVYLIQNATFRREIVFETKKPRIDESFRSMSARIRTLEGCGSGVAISEDMLLTNEHVIGENESVLVDVWSTEKNQYITVPGVVVKIIHSSDIAAIKIDGRFSSWTRMSSRQMSWGDNLVCVGCVGASLPIPRTGVFVGIVGSGPQQGQLQIQANVYPGSSGGGVFDADTGDLVGIMAGMEPPMRLENGLVLHPQFIGFAVPVEWISMFAKESLKHDKDKEATHGDSEKTP